MSDLSKYRERLAEVVGAHAYDYPDSFCKCGQWFDKPWSEHAPHVADALLASPVLAQIQEGGR